MAGALHALVLGGTAPELTARYPPHGPADRARVGQAALEALVNHAAFVRRFLRSPPQTNEVGRSAVLVGGFHAVARWGGLPLRLLEIGASAGLNTIWDRFRYRLGTAAWGPEDSPVALAPTWRGPAPPLAADLRIAARAACDAAPIDISNPEARLALCAYVWPDQRDRLDRLEAALSLAHRHGVPVERADARPGSTPQSRIPAEPVRCDGMGGQIRPGRAASPRRPARRIRRSIQARPVWRP